MGTSLDFRSCSHLFRLYSRRISWSDLVPIIDKTLTQCRHLKKLKKFLLCSTYEYRSESQVNNCVRYAVSREVEEFAVSCMWMDEFELTASCFTDVRLSDCVIDPIVPISWNKLRSLSISSLDEDVIENILSVSPLLETLELVYCDGYYRQLNITSKSVKNMVFSGYEDTDDPFDSHIFEINAPNILSLTIQQDLKVRNLLLVNVCSLVKANLDYALKWFDETSSKKAEEKMLKGLIQNLSHVKELKIGVSCSQVLAHLEARGFVFPSNLRIPDGFRRVEYVVWSESDEE